MSPSLPPHFQGICQLGTKLENNGAHALENGLDQYIRFVTVNLENLISRPDVCVQNTFIAKPEVVIPVDKHIILKTITA